MVFTTLALLLGLVGLIQSSDISDFQNTPSNTNDLFRIEGKIFTHDSLPLSKQYLVETKVFVNYGQYFGFLKPDGSFEISNLAPGSYVVEVSNPDFFYEPIRVDINSKGKIRARKINYIQATEVKQLTYPLKFKAKVPFKYFQIRETWKITDFIFNPMVLMMVLPLLFIMVLPKMMNANDPETQKELQNFQKMGDVGESLPELSEMVANWLGNKPNQQQPGPSNSQKQLKSNKKAKQT
ncbi:hypothetical protein RDWZM_001065 [Blomia tropicalis]|uniref:ER membrane protein complex subunit 7 beta-sandwich domain-containing protein n=1 Tax=Blomia tropicalis TaxID=40697 RepID=A0A9Q0RQD8_BLOTA|nr:hypothetical protein RDWZM_001065 [Blomia tropicalis]